MHVIQKLVAALTVAGVCGAASAAGTLVVDPPDSNVLEGAAFELKVLGTGFVANDVLGGGFNLTFNPSILTLDDVTFSAAAWEFFTSQGTKDNVAGTLTDVSFNSFNSKPTGNFEAATLHFTAKAPGTSAVMLAASAGFPFGGLLTAGEIPVTYGVGQVTVVPEPATLATLLLGLGLLPLVLRRRA